MRIIAGSHRGRNLIPPKDQSTTRPIVDRVKEALFNRLHSLGMLETPPDAEPFAVADLFAGTGSLGLEALSRGAEQCTFVERDRDALHRLEQNLDELGLGDRATVAASSALSPLWLTQLRGRPVRIAFLDPPYAMMQDPDDRDRLAVLLNDLLPRLEPGGVVVLRTPSDVDPLDAPAYDGPASVRYGSMTLHFYQRPM